MPRKQKRSRPMKADNDKTIPNSLVIRKGRGGPGRRAAPATQGRPGRVKSDAKRAAILKGAKAAFLKLGFEATSMDEVAGRAGVAKMTIYRHFGSKEDLFAGVITDLCNRIVAEELEQLFKQPPEEALRGYARRMIDIVFAPDTIELHRIVVAESRRFPKLGELFYASGPQVCIDVLARYLERQRGDARFRIADPTRTAEEFLELLRGYGHLRVLLNPRKTLTRREIEARIGGAVRHVLGS
jgi:TetR/AcrR family transcriptional regulator, mexJK operon transcriptional repressor